ncbi:MAG TPA: hypothetical protein DCR94_05020 [Firmicutes bacterium]|nr:hypothetical protein [Bacillota bacterium]
MEDRFYRIATLALSLFYFVVLFAHYLKGREKKNFNYARLMARSAIFGALSTILYVVPIFSINLPFLPSFLSLHFDEIPAFIAGYAYGPLTAFLVLFIKTLIKLPFSQSLSVGEFTDLILSAIFLLPSTLIYKKMRNLKGVFAGFVVGFFLQNVAALILNIYVMLPFYIFVMGMSEESLLSLCRLANASINDLKWSYGLFAVLPLNVIKDSIVLFVTFFAYRFLHKALRFESQGE